MSFFLTETGATAPHKSSNASPFLVNSTYIRLPTFICHQAEPVRSPSARVGHVGARGRSVNEGLRRGQARDRLTLERISRHRTTQDAMKGPCARDEALS